MPKYGIHHIVLKEAIKELENSGDSAASSAANIIRIEMPSATIGSIGPDLFFWGPDYKVVNTLYQLHQNIQAVVDEYNNIMRPIHDFEKTIKEEALDLADTLLPGTAELLEDSMDQIESTQKRIEAAIGTNIFTGVLTGANLITDAAGINSLAHQFFQIFVPGLQNNNNESKWYWFDMLHYRRTGKFAKYLVDTAVSNRQKAFAFGYLSHIATDVVGHPYVNQIVGTSYRLNVHRHVTVENYQDAWKYREYYNGESINETLLKRLGLPDKLHPEIGDLLFNAFEGTYDQTGDHPTFYTRNQIDETYDVFYDVLQLMKKMSIKRPEEPFSGVADILNDILDSFGPLPSSPDAPSSTCNWDDILGLTPDSGRCYEEFFRQIETWLNYLGELMKWALETIRNLVDLLLASLLSVPISVLLAILYGIQLQCYNIYRSARMLLSTTGFVMPEPDELDSAIARNLITLFHSCAVNFDTYPSIGSPVTNNLVCPVPVAERPSTAAGFYPPGIESTPDRFIKHKEEPLDEEALSLYALSPDPVQTRSIEGQMRSIGNATDFTAWMIQCANNENIPDDIVPVLFANWNLDADRGYGYLTWRGFVSQPPNNVGEEPYE